MAKHTITEYDVPQNYTMSLALFDAVPVILFAAASLLLWQMSGNRLILLGGLISFVSGMIKVLWKIIVVCEKKNIWWMFVQMRKGMPLGMTLLLIGFIVACLSGKLSAYAASFLRPLPLICLTVSVCALVAMIVCSAKLDPKEARANWIEESCNTLAQGAFLLAVLFTKPG